MSKLKYSDISENSVFVWDCPFCGHTHEDYENPATSDFDINCDDCGQHIEIDMEEE